MPIPLLTLCVTAAIMAALWALSLRWRDASIVDVYWGPGFALIALVALLADGDRDSRGVLLTVLTALWGLRLGAYLLWRNWGQGEDPRYQAMRRHAGAAFAWRSLFTVFGLQAVLMWFVSLPVQLAQIGRGATFPTLLDTVGVSLWAIGIAFEAVGDVQLARFKADPRNRGKVMDRGLWGLTRHPNYFGDALVWWGLYAIACATPAGRWTFASPLLMNFFLLRVSGVALLERRMAHTRPDYADYARRVNAFLPWPPKR